MPVITHAGADLNGVGEGDGVASHPTFICSFVHDRSIIACQPWYFSEKSTQDFTYTVLFLLSLFYTIFVLPSTLQFYVIVF